MQGFIVIGRRKEPRDIKLGLAGAGHLILSQIMMRVQLRKSLRLSFINQFSFGFLLIDCKLRSTHIREIQFYLMSWRMEKLIGKLAGGMKLRGCKSILLNMRRLEQVPNGIGKKHDQYFLKLFMYPSQVDV
jgi:hypothetical protein